mgnify:FL=1
MDLRTACIAGLTLAMMAGVVAANEAVDDEPVLRLRLQDPVIERVMSVTLRPRFDAGVTQVSEPVPMPKVSVSQAGRVGTFAYISTPHPNMVVAVGTTDDASEVGRQIDRAIYEMARGEMLFNRQSDSAPFIGVGVRSGPAKQGWSTEATVGMGVVNTPESSRLSAAYQSSALATYEAEARAHFKLRYTF